MPLREGLQKTIDWFRTIKLGDYRAADAELLDRRAPTMKVKCDNCRREFMPSDEQSQLIERSKAKDMQFIFIECPRCGIGSAVILKKGQELPNVTPTVVQSPDVQAGFPISQEEKRQKPFWGCGECGSIWRKLENLEREIEAIVAKFSYRRKSYRKKAGKWLPGELDKETRDYDERVENEPPDKSKKSVRAADTAKDKLLKGHWS